MYQTLFSTIVKYSLSLPNFEVAWQFDDCRVTVTSAVLGDNEGV